MLRFMQGKEIIHLLVIKIYYYYYIRHILRRNYFSCGDIEGKLGEPQVFEEESS